ncbi:hypothetical protein BP5796_05808 [Coleophoma crateriformis]|uniref:Sulfatase N-terminal domain-containing protein n=1 Tax=Coleophoma crateriformis TaxID=565419 RepID=A0A3D8RVF4_9HELO|nr:hypothetical protein BP5796_05808 [Coleophoma crateriformis]
MSVKRCPQLLVRLKRQATNHAILRPIDNNLPLSGLRKKSGKNSSYILRDDIQARRQFGRVMEGLRQTNVHGKITTMFYTDHGEYLGDHGMVEKWPSGVSEVLAREPMITGGAGLPSGQVCDDVCEMVDLLPTVFELCEISEHFPHNGTSLMPSILARTKHPKMYAYTEGGSLTSEEPLLEQAPYPYDIKSVLQHEDTMLVGKVVSRRHKDWCYVYRLYEPAELYNRKPDIGKLQNLAADPLYADVVREIQAEMFQWTMETTDLLPFEKDARFPLVSLESPKEQYLRRL